MQVLKGNIVSDVLKNTLINKEIRFVINEVYFTGKITSFKDFDNETIFDTDNVTFVIDHDTEYECCHTEASKMLELQEVK